MVALSDLEKGSLELDGELFGLVEDIPQKHKFFLEDIPKGGKVTMYGVPVGTANVDLVAGSLMTTENISHFANKMDPSKREEFSWKALETAAWRERTFMGYQRSDGRVGTANYWLFIPLVFCENRNLKIIEETLLNSLGYKKPNKYMAFAEELLGSENLIEPQKKKQVFKNVDGVKFLYHDGGCGSTKHDAETLLRLLVSYTNHPNVAGATILSLGCQHAQVRWFQEINKELYPDSDKPILFYEQQQVKSEEQLIKGAIKDTVEQLKIVDSQSKRQPASLDKLVLGLECGGSDGFSGISANPAVGQVSDMVVSLGGATILSEFPELNGVEQEILNRSKTQELAEKFYRIQTEYEKSAKAVGSGFDMNPSPGNIKDGLITDAIKSAGAAKKGGTAPISDVLDYTEHVSKPGLNLLCTPGNDVESTTGLAGAGANIILFTTGLGTPTGNPVAPVVKISSNTRLFEKMSDIIDFNTGEIIEGKKSIEEVGEELLEKIIAVASGEETKAMELEQNDFIYWKRGVSL
ncbi:MAG: altronate dehydratase [Ekhidna sp.]|nr:altronate dehydratase [Ekhidna sp.]